MHESGLEFFSVCRCDVRFRCDDQAVQDGRSLSTLTLASLPGGCGCQTATGQDLLLWVILTKTETNVRCMMRLLVWCTIRQDKVAKTVAKRTLSDDGMCMSIKRMTCKTDLLEGCVVTFIAGIAAFSHVEIFIGSVLSHRNQKFCQKLRVSTHQNHNNPVSPCGVPQLSCSR